MRQVRASGSRGRNVFRRVAKSNAAFVVFLVVSAVVAALLFVGIKARSDAAVATPGVGYTAPVAQAPAGSGNAEAAAKIVRNIFSDSSKPSSVAIIGDSTGDEPAEWVYRLGRWASEKFNRPVILHPWDLNAAQYGAYGAPVTLGEGAGEPLTIWNGSAPGKSIQYSTDMLRSLLPQEPIAAVFISHGHNQGVTDVIGPLERLTAAVLEAQPDAGLVLIGQNPNRQPDETKQAEKVTQVLNFVGTTYPAIDVFSAFNASPDPNSLLKDSQHPNEQGSQLWAQTVQDWLTVQK